MDNIRALTVCKRCIIYINIMHITKMSEKNNKLHDNKNKNM